MRTYTQDEKQAVIDRVISGELSTHILADTGIPKSTFYGWLRAYREEQEADNRRTVSIRNFHLLENKVARLESIVEILKSAPCTPKAPLRQRLYAAEQLYGKYNVHVICDAFDIPRGTFYNHVLRNKRITRGMRNAVKNCGFVSRKSLMKAIKYSVLLKLRQL